MEVDADYDITVFATEESTSVPCELILDVTVLLNFYSRGLSTSVKIPYSVYGVDYSKHTEDAEAAAAVDSAYQRELNRVIYLRTLQEMGQNADAKHIEEVEAFIRSESWHDGDSHTDHGLSSSAEALIAEIRGRSSIPFVGPNVPI